MGLDQKFVSSRSGVSQQRISEIERGKVDPRITTLLKILGGVGVQPSDFFGELPEVEQSQSHSWK